ncbi:MAG: ABC transporter permease [Myxococcales bacterium]|jgi:lipopolysaccharide transport system permease protein
MIGELIRKREVLATLVEKDFKSRYKAKALGRLWSIADPLVMVVIFTIVFAHILKVAQPFFPIFLLLGLTPYRFFANSVNGAATSVLDNVQLVKKVSFPRLMLPLAVVFSHLRHFFIELVLVAALFLYFPEAFHLSWNLLWLPLLLGVQMVFIMGVGLAVAALNVRYRDTQYILNSALLVMYWLTPLFYAFSFVPYPYDRVLMWNPMVGVVEGYRAVLLEGSAPGLMVLGAGTISALLTLAIGAAIFKHFESNFADYL